MKIQQDAHSISTAKEKGISGASKAKDLNRAAKSEDSQSVSTSNSDSYSVNLSKSAEDTKKAYERAHKIAMATPSVREDKVAEFKERIKNGQYQVDSGKVADGILREAIKDQLASSN